MRVIVRNTSEYRNLLDNPPDNILQSELEQMNRGDVPFYFKFSADKNLYWLEAKDLVQTEMSVGIFQRDINRHGKYEDGGWCQARATHQILSQGLLFLIKHLGGELNLQLSDQAKIDRKRVLLGHQIFTA